MTLSDLGLLVSLYIIISIIVIYRNIELHLKHHHESS